MNVLIFICTLYINLYLILLHKNVSLVGILFRNKKLDRKSSLLITYMYLLCIRVHVVHVVGKVYAW